MRSQFIVRWCSLSLAAATVACGSSEPVAVSTEPPAAIAAMSDLTRTTAVGTVIPGAIVVKVTDASGRPVQGASVGFTVTAGNGTVDPRVALTDAKGEATATWTVGTILGANEVTATVAGVSKTVAFQATGVPGSVSAISLSTQNARLLVNVDTARVTARSLDAFGNVTSPAPVFTVRDPSLISIDGNGLVHALRRGSSTYVVATAAGKSDSTLVTVLAPGQSVCTAAASPLVLSIGQVVNDVSGTGICIHAAEPNAEYALIPFFDAGLPSTTTAIEFRPIGIAPLPIVASALRRPTTPSLTSTGLERNVEFEASMRERERIESVNRPVAVRGMKANRNVVGAAAQLTVPAIGDLLNLNANAVAFCDQPDYRTGRVVAITDKAIIVADTANPKGGFTTDEFKSIGVTFDTLINRVDTAAFGKPSDIDNNGRVIMFFTRAVNELTSQGSPGGVVLGFYYRRDLYPKTGSADGNCPASNVGEMFYLLVPDTAGTINGNKRLKADVVAGTLSTVAHEYQHLINASQRMYGANPTNVFEEKWLDEGLSHIAEDLNFWASSGLKRRSNVDKSVFSDPATLLAYNTYANFNVRRYSTYLTRTETQGPVGFDSNDDDLQTRGAIWSLLRYIADQKFQTNENSFWNALANSRIAGMANLTAALGTAPDALMRDWAISVFTDDNNNSPVDPRYTQPSWNTRSIITNGGTSIPYPLLTRAPSDNTTTTLSLSGFGVSFIRFSVANGQEALLTVSGANGQALSSGVKLSVVRLR